MFALLQTAVKNDPKNAELLWRLARASRLMVLDVRTNSDDKKRLAYDCLKYAKEAVKADDGNWAAHKWLAIGYKVVGDYEGTKSKIQNAYVIRDEFRRALELNPTDATTTCLLGQWCFYFADMPWYERQIAGTLFASPPTSTFEEALAFFHKAEKLSPGFYKTNKMYLAKSYSRLGQVMRVS
jgi:tetratricopeptide (TPR) repeat protein